jgi:hypothetical protein
MNDPNTVIKYMLSNILVDSPQLHNIRDIKKNFDTLQCMEWGGAYYKNKPYFGPMMLVGFPHDVRRFLFEQLWGPLQPRMRLHPTMWCKLKCPPEKAWCVNPYHMIFNMARVDYDLDHDTWYDIAPEVQETIMKRYKHYNNQQKRIQGA